MYKLFMKKSKLKLQGPSQSKVSEELSVRATMANNVSCFKMDLGMFGGISVCDSKGLCSEALPILCCSHAESWVTLLQD